jgi:branched-chain amino acid transport system substrate-binding protein
MKIKKLLNSIAIFSIAFALIFCLTSCKKKEPETIKIGAILPLTGPAAFFGQVAKAGLELGIEDVKKFKGVKIDVIYEDSQANPGIALNSFRKLITRDKVDVIITTVYSVGMILKPEAEKNKVPLFATVIAPNFPQGTKYVIRHAPLITDDVSLLLEFLNKNNISKAVLLYQMDDYGQAFRDLLEKSNIKQKIMSEPFNPKDVDFRSLIYKIIKFHPDAISIVGFTQAVGTLIKQIREAGYSGLIHASLGFPFTPDFLKDASYLKGVIYNGINLDENAEYIKSIYRRLKERYGQEKPSSLSILFYDWAILVGEVYSRYKIKSAEELITAVKSLKKLEYPGISCEITSDGEIIVPSKLKIY